MILLRAFCLFFLFGCTVVNAQSEAEVLLQATQSWDGSALPEYPDGTPEITLLKISIQPDTTLPWHKHPIINAAVILSGELKVVTRDGAEMLFSAGDALVETVDKWHYGVNEGSEVVQLIVFYAGIVDTPLSIQEAE